MIPRLVKTAFCMIFAFLVMPWILPTIPPRLHFAQLCFVGFQELMIGILMGLSLRIVLGMVEFAGQVISSEAGLMRSESFNPILMNSSSPLGSLLFYFSVLLFFALHLEQDVILSFMESYRWRPVQWTGLSLWPIAPLLMDTSRLFVIGVKIAAPMIALNFLVNMTFAVLGKAAPKINVFVLSFAFRILVGFFLLAMLIHLLGRYIVVEWQRVPVKMLQFLMP